MKRLLVLVVVGVGGILVSAAPAGADPTPICVEAGVGPWGTRVCIPVP